MFGTFFDFLLVVLGFGLIIFVHELGHFLAARWAGIRVLAFAVGMGPALLSFRKGLGLRTGSSSEQYDRLQREAGASAGAAGVAALRSRVSATEYRLNLLPIGGYVKMLGQEDGNPYAISDAADSYQQCKPWKRLIVISAGVAMNLITAAALFVVVFMVGMRVEPARVGAVVPGSAAAQATLVDSGQVQTLGVDQGLQAGDRILLVDERTPNSFSDLALAGAMAKRDSVITLRVLRDGPQGSRELTFVAKPLPSTSSGLLELGIEPSLSRELADGRTPQEDAAVVGLLASQGLSALEPGASLLSVDGREVADGTALAVSLRRSGGVPVQAEFRNPGSPTPVVVTLAPLPALQTDFVPRQGGKVSPVQHILGLSGVMMIAQGEMTERAAAAGLRAGDIFARIGGIEYPGIADGISEVQAHASRTIQMTVLRKDAADGTYKDVELPAVAVGSNGRIGFSVSDTTSTLPLISLPPQIFVGSAGKQVTTPAAYGVFSIPGAMIVSVAGEAVAHLWDVRVALQKAVSAAAGPSGQVPGDVIIPIRFRRPLAGIPSDSAQIETLAWTIPSADAARVMALGWEEPPVARLFEVERVLLKASSPSQALIMGIAETRRVMLTTYVTFLRLFEGTVKVEHLKGPVGIAHLGTLVAGKGFIWLLFFLALISVNLAVVNFLPLPIVDGGNFLFVLFEQIRGRPVSLAVQSAATMAGLAFLGMMFLVVTYNDIRNLLGF